MHTRIAHVAHVGGASSASSSSWWSPTTAAPATSASATSSPSSSAELLSYTKICEPGGRGLLLPLLAAENELPYGPRVPLYLLELLWLFLGVAIVADIFMAAIEQITSQEKKVTLMVRGEWTSYYVRVWNPTVANLSLMALGSSAPEIMLSVIELFSNGMHTGELGPSTIVGSAAFNMLIILAICILAIPDGETRSIKGRAGRRRATGARAAASRRRCSRSGWSPPSFFSCGACTSSRRS